MAVRNQTVAGLLRSASWPVMLSGDVTGLEKRVGGALAVGTSLVIAAIPDIPWRGNRLTPKTVIIQLLELSLTRSQTVTECNHEAFASSNCRKRRVRVNFSGGSTSPNGGALLLREVDRRMGLTTAVARVGENRD